MRGYVGRLAASAMALAGIFVTAGVAQAAPRIEVQEGRTQPVFGYADAIRERVFIPLPGVDQDLNGEPDRTAIDIIRPRATGQGLKAPAIIDPSPYYTTLGRGHEGSVSPTSTATG
jgi:X-Pro dipeptidyl-peptidase